MKKGFESKSVKGGNSMKKRKKRIGLIILLLVFGLTAGYVANTYAKYTAQVSGSGTATVAKWAFASDNASTNFTINLDGTIDASTLMNDRIAPGTSGSFDIALSNANSEVGVEFTISFSNAQNVPSNLVFKQGGSVVDITTQTITGKIAAGDTLTVPVTWEWPYYTSAADDVEDTTDGVAGNTMTVNTTITGVQVQPGAAITTGIN
jgi:hypothetical protein